MGSHPNPNPHKKCPQHGLQKVFFISPDTAAWQIWQHSPLTQKQPPRASAGILPGCKQKLLLLPCTSLSWCLFIHPRTLKQAALLSCMHMSLQFHRNYAEQVHGLIGICNPPAQQK